MSSNILSVWKYGTVNDIRKVTRQDGSTELKYQIRFEIGGRISHKTLPLKSLAYSGPAKVRLQVGTRIIGLYLDPDNPNGPRDFYAGIVAEPPKGMNKHRYLVFFDDGYASYIRHNDIRFVIIVS